MRRKRRVRMHLAESHPGVSLPSVEGLLIGKGHEYRLAVPRLLIAEGANPAELESREVVIPRERVAFYEVLA